MEKSMNKADVMPTGTAGASTNAGSDGTTAQNPQEGTKVATVSESFSKGAALISQAHKEKIEERAAYNQRTKDAKMDGFVIVGFVLTALGVVFPLFSLIGLILFFYGLWHAKQYERRGRQLAIAGILISIITALIGLTIWQYLLPLITSITSAATSFGEAADGIAKVFGGSDEFDALFEMLIN